MKANVEQGRLNVRKRSSSKEFTLANAWFIDYLDIICIGDGGNPGENDTAMGARRVILLWKTKDYWRPPIHGIDGSMATASAAQQIVYLICIHYDFDESLGNSCRSAQFPFWNHSSLFGFCTCHRALWLWKWTCIHATPRKILHAKRMKRYGWKKCLRLYQTTIILSCSSLRISLIQQKNPNFPSVSLSLCHETFLFKNFFYLLFKWNIQCEYSRTKIGRMKSEKKSFVDLRGVIITLRFNVLQKANLVWINQRWIAAELMDFIPWLPADWLIPEFIFHL